MFYVSDNENYLLQLQPSRFLANWRKRRDHDQYPRFTTAFTRFLRGWETLLAFATEEKLGSPPVNQYELTYINHIEEATLPFPAGIQEHLDFFRWRDKTMLLPAPRGVHVRLQFPLPDGRGMLHVTVTHGSRASDRKGVVVLDLTARGPARNDWSAMKAWFEMAHEWIVKGFTDLTTADAHSRWERER